MKNKNIYYQYPLLKKKKKKKEQKLNKPKLSFIFLFCFLVTLYFKVSLLHKLHVLTIIITINYA